MADLERFQLDREDVTDRVSVLALSGDADRFRADVVGDAIDEVRQEDREVVVDLSGTSYLDSSMLSALVAASERSRRRAEPLVIVCPSERLRRSLQIKGLEAILRIVDTREEALDLLANDEPMPG
jgi:anti-sigma B factor antagonist